MTVRSMGISRNVRPTSLQLAAKLAESSTFSNRIKAFFIRRLKAVGGSPQDLQSSLESAKRKLKQAQAEVNELMEKHPKISKQYANHKPDYPANIRSLQRELQEAPNKKAREGLLDAHLLYEFGLGGYEWIPADHCNQVLEESKEVSHTPETLGRLKREIKKQTKVIRKLEALRLAQTGTLQSKPGKSIIKKTAGGPGNSSTNPKKTVVFAEEKNQIKNIKRKGKRGYTKAYKKEVADTLERGRSIFAKMKPEERAALTDEKRRSYAPPLSEEEMYKYAKKLGQREEEAAGYSNKEFIQKELDKLSKTIKS
jgi:hypothetical protein